MRRDARPRCSAHTRRNLLLLACDTHALIKRPQARKSWLEAGRRGSRHCISQLPTPQPVDSGDSRTRSQEQPKRPTYRKQLPRACSRSILRSCFDSRHGAARQSTGHHAAANTKILRSKNFAHVLQSLVVSPQRARARTSAPTGIKASVFQHLARRAGTHGFQVIKSRNRKGENPDFRNTTEMSFMHDAYSCEVSSQPAIASINA